MNRLARFDARWGGLIEELAFIAGSILCAIVALDIIVDFAAWVLS